MKFHFLVQTQTYISTHKRGESGSTFYIRKGNRYFLHTHALSENSPAGPLAFCGALQLVSSLIRTTAWLPINHREARIKLFPKPLSTLFLTFRSLFSKAAGKINKSRAGDATAGSERAQESLFTDKRSFPGALSRFVFVLVACAVFLLPPLFDLSECR